MKLFDTQHEQSGSTVNFPNLLQKQEMLENQGNMGFENDASDSYLRSFVPTSSTQRPTRNYEFNNADK